MEWNPNVYVLGVWKEAGIVEDKMQRQNKLERSWNEAWDCVSHYILFMS